MGCLFGCFRVAGNGGSQPGGGQHQLASCSVPSNPKIGERRQPSKNPLSAVFLREDERSPEQLTCLGPHESTERKMKDQELKREARFLNKCGALLETPDEILKASENANSADQNGTSSTHSSLPAMPCKLLFMEGQKVEDCQTPSGSRQSSSLPDAGSSTCKGYEVSCQHDLDAVSKPLHAECAKDESVIDPGTELITLNSSSFQRKDDDIPLAGSKSSPFPTPLKVTDEMQTPATAHPATLEKLRNGKNTRARVQYIYPVLNPVEDFGKWTVLREGSCQPDQSEENFQCENNGSLDSVETSISDECSIFHGSEGSMSSSNKRGDNKSPTTEATTDASSKKVTVSHDPDVQVPSLSQWLKPPNPKRAFRDETFTNDRSHSGKSSEEERPIIGMVAAHWKDKEPEIITPKWWDGNGIPNSTNKYKEDQKVSWHATPFEERLEKALSDEKLLSQRKCSSGKTSEFSGVEGEESDTAASNSVSLAAFA